VSLSARSTAPATVAVIGAGASGALAAMHVARTAARHGRSVEILLVDRGEPGRGVAYSTTDPRHRLNVPAAQLSAWPDRPDDFVTWLRRHVDVAFADRGFAPRLHYGQYLAAALEDAVRVASGVRLTHVCGRVTDLRLQGRRLRLTLDDGTARAADAAVLATGYGAPSVSWAPQQLRASSRFVADPWSAEVPAPELPAGSSVVLVGAGLTMCDMALRWGRAGVRVHAVSRHGVLPLAHAPSTAARTPELPSTVTLPALRRMVFEAIRAADGDWRAAIDSLRPVTQAAWRALPAAERDRFLKSGARRWDRVRHRIDPSLHAWLDERCAEGALVAHAGTVVAARELADAVEVTLSDGTTVRAAAVVNCTGASSGLRGSADPLALNLLDSGMVRPDPFDLGIATEPDGRVAPGLAVFAVGPLRRGMLWESTAVPEIRAQAAELAEHVVAALPHPRLVRRVRDPYGLPLTAAPKAAGLYNEALGRILRVQSGAEALVAGSVAADPDFAVGHATRALLGVEWGADVDVEAALNAAERCAPYADEREQRFVEVAAARVREPGAPSAAALLAYIHAYPEDALAVSIAVPTIAFGGATEIPAEAWALVEGLEPAYGDDWFYLGMLAFIRQEQNRFAEAGELAARALAAEPAAGHAVHAKTHVHYETGDHVAGLAWLDRWIATCGAAASHRAHFSWHAALHELALGDDAAVRRRYANQLAPPMVSGVRALVDSASLLWRGHVLGTWDRMEVAEILETVPRELLLDPPTPFTALHAALALAAAGDCHGLAALRRSVRGRGAVFTSTVAPLADALSDLVHGDAERATHGLRALPEIDRLGGSAAQREVVEDTLIYAATLAGRTEVARELLAERLDRRSSPRDAARLRACAPSESAQASLRTSAPNTAAWVRRSMPSLPSRLET
jgi:uncharacterized NAD(P)/FAD-binding protein YdhS/tetratricopeptide (TPR) repeat protein